MTHITVERNRRKQMNEYLAGDQASIIGGAINFVKELEHKFHLLGAKKEEEYSTSSSGSNSATTFGEKVGEIQSCIADIEVTMVESHANIKIRSKKRPKQLLKIVEDDCKLGSVDDIAAAVYQMVNSIQQEQC
ncbi:hypothetical protein TSUD_32070 [Trifolium subterraneum]|uniref:BHLH domain-containing protein n=1 Tax=Trifolium subterraneum TaxID=3900 RepID=A0A2Z6NZX6_TRISU|nr:hypothetical protein TSUD_32070 [Trifolium subterraneum]